jgi:hypothetical protein
VAAGAQHAATGAANLHTASGHASSGLAGLTHSAHEAGEAVHGLWEHLERGAALLGVGLGIREIIEQFKELAEHAEHTENVAAALGIETEEYSKLSGALTLVGGNAETARRALISLQVKTVEAAESTGRPRDAMRSLGYSFAGRPATTG